MNLPSGSEVALAFLMGCSAKTTICLLSRGSLREPRAIDPPHSGISRGPREF